MEKKIKKKISELRPILKTLDSKMTTGSFGILALVSVAYILSLLKSASGATTNNCPHPEVPSGDNVVKNNWENSWSDHDNWSDWCGDWSSDWSTDNNIIT